MSKEDKVPDSHWNYRVFKDPGLNEDYFTIREVFYTVGVLNGYTDPIEPHGDSLLDLKANLERMKEAFDKPILTAEDFNKPLKKENE